jgi:hypothetical protein
MYVCRLLHIGRIRMDIDNSRGYLGPRQNLQGIQRYVVTGILAIDPASSIDPILPP